MRISDYDEHDYEYITYWKDREYEHLSEEHLLKTFFKNENGSWIIDIGGSYGRLLPIYADKYVHKVIVDYSIKTLQANKNSLSDKYENVHLIAANAYYLPFKDNTFDAGLMVRVLHHIEKPKLVMNEISRLLKLDGIYVQEYANKMHIKAVLKALLRGKFEFFTTKPYQQPTLGGTEGSDGVENVFLNFHPKFINSLFTSNNLEIKCIRGASYFRIPRLKKLVGNKLLFKIERFIQPILSFTNTAPSIFVKTIATKSSTSSQKYSQINDILCCPKCKGNLEINNNNAKCSLCKKNYMKVKNIWDFRINES